MRCKKAPLNLLPVERTYANVLLLCMQFMYTSNIHTHIHTHTHSYTYTQYIWISFNMCIYFPLHKCILICVGASICLCVRMCVYLSVSFVHLFACVRVFTCVSVRFPSTLKYVINWTESDWKHISILIDFVFLSDGWKILSNYIPW